MTEKTWEELHDELAEQLAAARAEIARQANLIIELGAKLHVAQTQSPLDRIEQFERDELGGRTLNEFLADKA